MRIKGFDKNLQCRGFQYEVGKEYKIENEGKPIELCTDTVFHYCNSLEQVHLFYSANPQERNRFCEIEVLGDEIDDGRKCGSDHIRILREIKGKDLEMLQYIADEEQGIFNSGKNNKGNSNSGHWNIGHSNSGHWNQGHNNSGSENIGSHNSGDKNSGHGNSGQRNIGNLCSGDFNSGDMNSGSYNSGKRCTGDYNSGRSNSGDYNSGNVNSGNHNSGDRNSGHFNSGNWNSGIFNSCDYSTGVFCNHTENNIKIFNIPSGLSLEQFYMTEYWRAINDAPFELISWESYSEDEKRDNIEMRNIQGSIKTYQYQEACKNWWAKLPNRSKEIIESMPNFDPEVFKDITGISL